MRLFIGFIISVLVCFSSPPLKADAYLKVNGPIDPALTEVVFRNSEKVKPEIFENNHHAIIKCYKISGGYLTFISSGEGLFKGYELNKSIPPELLNKNLPLVDEVVQNKAGIHLGLPSNTVERIINHDLLHVETMLSYESTQKINGMPYDVISTVIIRFENGKLVKFLVITSTTS